MAGKKLSVRMFGRFSARYADEILALGRQRDSKFRQLFQILMTRPGQDFSKLAVAESLYGWDEVEDSNASLNNTIFRLRTYLEASPLPQGEYLFCEAGILRFGGNITVESDVWEFGKLADEFDREQDRRKKLPAVLFCQIKDKGRCSPAEYDDRYRAGMLGQQRGGTR